ncbi:hypothetical protein EXIGLDRAFT_784545, partial [Exidia glandulosa HHB12029]
MSDSPDFEEGNGPFLEDEGPICDLSDVMESLIDLERQSGHLAAGMHPYTHMLALLAKADDGVRHLFGIDKEGNDELVSDDDEEDRLHREELIRAAREKEAEARENEERLKRAEEEQKEREQKEREQEEHTRQFLAIAAKGRIRHAPAAAPKRTLSGRKGPSASTSQPESEVDAVDVGTSKKRQRKSTSQKNPEERAAHAWGNWERLNTRMIQNAVSNSRVYHDLDLRQLVNAEQRQLVSNKAVELYSQAQVVRWTFDPISDRGVKARVALDKNNIPFLIVCNSWIGLKAHENLLRILTQFGHTAKVKVRDDPADKNTRDDPASYTRRKFHKEVHGVFQLVSIWRALGRSKTEPGPSTDVFKTVENLNASISLLRDLRIVTQRIDNFIMQLDPTQHAALTQANDDLRQKYPAYDFLSAASGSYFHGRSLIYNRETPEHNDRRDMKFAWTPLLTLGKYTEGWIRVLDLEI